MIINNKKYKCKAVKFAAIEHKDELRESWEMYILHPLGVMNNVIKLKIWKEYEQASVLHDVIENCFISKDEIELKFWTIVSDLVYFLTKNPKYYYSNDDIWSYKRLIDYIARIEKWMLKYPNLIFIKMLDQLDNLDSLHIFRKDKFYRILYEIKDNFIPLYKKYIDKVWIDLKPKALKLFNKLNNKIDSLIWIEEKHWYLPVLENIELEVIKILETPDTQMSKA